MSATVEIELIVDTVDAEPSSDFLLAWRAAVDMEVKVLRVLVSAEVRQDSTCAVLSFHVGSHLANNVHDACQQVVWSVAEVGERRHMTLRNDHDVYGPERACVMERQNRIGLDHDIDSRSSADRLVAVEVIAHSSSIAHHYRRGGKVRPVENVRPASPLDLHLIGAFASFQRAPEHASGRQPGNRRRLRSTCGFDTVLALQGASQQRRV